MGLDKKIITALAFTLTACSGENTAPAYIVPVPNCTENQRASLTQADLFEGDRTVSIMGVNVKRGPNGLDYNLGELKLVLRFKPVVEIGKNGLHITGNSDSRFSTLNAVVTNSGTVTISCNSKDISG